MCCWAAQGSKSRAWGSEAAMPGQGVYYVSAMSGTQGAQDLLSTCGLLQLFFRKQTPSRVSRLQSKQASPSSATCNGPRFKGVPQKNWEALMRS